MTNDEQWSTDTPMAGYVQNKGDGKRGTGLCINVDDCGTDLIYYTCTATPTVLHVPGVSHNDPRGGPPIILLGPFWARFSAPLCPARAVCCVLLGAHADRVMIGAWTPMM